MISLARDRPDLRTETRDCDPCKHGKRYLVCDVGATRSPRGLDILVDETERVRSLERNDVPFICVGGGSGGSAFSNLPEITREKSMTFNGRIPDEYNARRCCGIHK